MGRLRFSVFSDTGVKRNGRDFFFRIFPYRPTVRVHTVGTQSVAPRVMKILARNTHRFSSTTEALFDCAITFRKIPNRHSREGLFLRFENLKNLVSG